LGATLLPTLLSSAIVNPPGFTDGFDMGNVLPTGLSVASVTADLTVKYQTLNGSVLKNAGLVLTVAPPPPINAFNGPGVLWSDPANWSQFRAPAASDKVSLIAASPGSRAITIDQDAPKLIDLRADASSAGGSVDITLGPARSLSIQTDMTLGYAGAASFTQSSGSNSIGGHLFIGVTPGSHGAYNVSGGALSAAGIFIGAGWNAGGGGGVGVITQTGGTVTINGSGVTDALVLGNARNAVGTYELGGTGSLIANREWIGNSGSGIFIQTGGANIVTTNKTSGSGGISISNNGTLTLSGGLLSATAIDNYGTLNLLGGVISARVTNSGTIVLGPGIDASNLKLYNSPFSEGVIRLAPGGTTVISMQSLQISTSAKIDVAAAGILFNYGALSPLSGVKVAVAYGRHGGAWNGTVGITSSLAVSDPNHWAVGFADGAAHVVSGLAAGQFLIRAAPIGDANLDGKVDGSDITQILHRGKFNGDGSKDGWIDGDQNADGVVNSTDIRTIALSGAYAGGAGGPAARASALAVPAAAPGLPAYTYDPTTGDVTFLPNGVTDIVDLHVRSTAGKFLPASSTFTSFPTKTNVELESTLFGSNFDAGYDLGAILPSGLTLAALQGDVALLYGVSGAGVEQSATIAVPEPSTAITSAALSGALAILRVRKRRKPD
jgi:hypothetical protein